MALEPRQVRRAEGWHRRQRLARRSVLSANVVRRALQVQVIGWVVFELCLEAGEDCVPLGHVEDRQTAGAIRLACRNRINEIVNRIYETAKLCDGGATLNPQADVRVE